MDHDTLKRAFEETPLFAGKTWKLSPEPFPLTPDQLAEVERIGEACAEFYLAVERLYRRSVDGRRLLRNGELEAGWVVDYLERGKPGDLVAHGLAEPLHRVLPPVIRPDILLTGDGLAVTEIDAVPGGIGLTAFLNRLYETEFDDLVGSSRGMVEGFLTAVAGAEAIHRNPYIAIVVSDEAETYRPEMEWLAAELQRWGKRVFVHHPSELMPLGDSLCVGIEGNPQKVDIVYRFFELFDLPNLGIRPFIFSFVEKELVRLAPAMKHYQEEKLNLGLFHHPRLEAFWRENLSKGSFRCLSRCVPRTWVVDPTPVPAHAFLHGPTVGGRPVSDWTELAAGSQKERSLILKISGFHETSWGARSVALGSDLSREGWHDALAEAVRMGSENLFVLQEFRKPSRLPHPVFTGGNGDSAPMDGRVRLCPYFFAEPGGSYGLKGILATVCPADKKIIHGMSDAALLPCRVVEGKE